MTLTLIPIIGAIGVGAEASAWYLVQRAAQNAADAAVMAAAANACTSNCSPNSTYAQEALATATKLGFSNDADTVVTPGITSAAPCPSGSCYTVTITHKVPYYLLKIVGFKSGTTNAQGVASQTVGAVAMAQRQPGRPYCITALGSANDAILLNGANQADFSNCDGYAPNGGARCNGINAQGAFRTTYMTNPSNSNVCPGRTQLGEAFTDNFASKASEIPPDLCGGNWPKADKGVPTLERNKITDGSQLNGPFCGDIRLEGDVIVPANQTVYIYNGQFDLDGHTLRTADGAGLTVVFTGQDSSRVHAFVSKKNGALVDIAAPVGTPGVGWSGIAIYQDPTIPDSKNLDFDYSGNELAIHFSGLFYAPKATVNLSGSTTFASYGAACIAVIVDLFRIDGTVQASTAKCDEAGLGGLPQAYNLINLVA